MMFEAYVAIALLVLGAVALVVAWADGHYQEARRSQRLLQRGR